MKWPPLHTNISQLDDHHGKWIGALHSPHINMLPSLGSKTQNQVWYFYQVKRKCNLFYFYICISWMFQEGQVWPLISGDECELKESPLAHILNGPKWSSFSNGSFPEGDLIIFQGGDLVSPNWFLIGVVEKYEWATLALNIFHLEMNFSKLFAALNSWIKFQHSCAFSWLQEVV